MIPGWAEILLRIGVAASTVAVVIFVIQWTLTAPWWHDPVGRTVVVKDAGLLTLLVPNTISAFARHAVPFMFLVGTDIASLFIVTFAMVWRCIVWWRIKRPQSPLALWRAYQHIHRAQADKDS